MNTRHQTRSLLRSKTRTISVAALAPFLLGMLVAQVTLVPRPVAAESWHAGWSTFETGTWEPDYSWPEADDDLIFVEVLGVNQIHGVIAKGTAQATDFYVYDSQVPGPTVAVIGGMHGNETAGYRAGAVVRDYWVKKGKLLVIPEANRVAIKAKKRTSKIGDLNRSFPRTKSGTPTNYLARGVFTVMKQYKPDWLIDMHEGYGYHKLNSSSVGQTVIYYPKASAATMAKAMASAASKTVTTSSHAFSVLKYPAPGSLARAVSIQLGTRGMIVETCNKQSLSLRIKQHEAAVMAMLTRLGMR